MKNMNEINRVFYHELGHFVSLELNKKYYNGFGCAEIKIYPDVASGRLDFLGKTISIKPTGFSKDEPTPLNFSWLSENLVNFCYGCIFQAYFLSGDFDDCFEIGSHGDCDLNKWIGSFTTY
jgi:hypothetical protein